MSVTDFDVSNVGGHERVEAEFFHRDTELAQLALVGLNHVRMCLADLLEFSLDRLDCLVFDVLHLVKSASDHAQTVRIDVGGGQNLINTSLLSIKAFLDCLKLLLENQIAQACLLMELVNESVELIKDMLSLLLEILNLLKFHFEFPFGFLVPTFN